MRGIDEQVVLGTTSPSGNPSLNSACPAGVMPFAWTRFSSYAARGSLRSRSPGAVQHPCAGCASVPAPMSSHRLERQWSSPRPGRCGRRRCSSGCAVTQRAEYRLDLALAAGRAWYQRRRGPRWQMPDCRCCKCRHASLRRRTYAKPACASTASGVVAHSGPGEGGVRPHAMPGIRGVDTPAGCLRIDAMAGMRITRLPELQYEGPMLRQRQGRAAPRWRPRRSGLPAPRQQRSTTRHRFNSRQRQDADSHR
jgi:hypothetical protein